MSQDKDDRLIEVDIKNKESIELFKNYYNEIYINAFQNANERESLENLIKCLSLKYTNWYKRNNYHILLLCDNNKALAGIIFDYFYEPNVGAIEFIAVGKHIQKNGVGSLLYNKALEILIEDAKKNNKENLNYVFCEVEKKLEKDNEVIKKARNFWSKHKFKQLDFDYIQPALDKNKECVNSLNLIVSSHKELNEIPSEILKNFLYGYTKYTMNIKEPNKDIYVRNMFKTLDNKNKISLKNM